MFDAAALDSAVHQALSSVPASNHNALVGTVDEHGVQIVVAMTKEVHGATWQVQGVYGHDWATGDDHIAGRVLVSW